MRVSDEELAGFFKGDEHPCCIDCHVALDLRDARAALREIANGVCECDDFKTPCDSCIAYKALEVRDE